MRTYFYNRTAYSLNIPNITVPQFFIELDKHFGRTSVGLGDDSVILAENLCRRMADIEFYAHNISETKKGPDKFRSSIIIGTLLVGYFNACKSLLDAGSITLSKIYALTLSNKQMDFSKDKFWRELEDKTGIIIKGRYLPFKQLIKDIISWRDAAVHRITPFIIVHSPDKPSEVAPNQKKIKMVPDPDANISTVMQNIPGITWVEPLHYHAQWHDQLIDFCQEVCIDIKGKTV